MAKIYYLREGSGPERIIEDLDISLEKLMMKVGNRTAKFVGNQPPTYPTEREDLTPYRDPSRTLAQIAAGEVNNKFPKEGLYLLEGVEPKEANAWN